MRIAQLADIHFGSEDAGAIRVAREIINACGVDIVAICGDITQNGAKEEFAAARAWVDQLLPHKIVVPGNHDTPMFGLPQRVLRPWSRFQRAFGQLNAPILTQNIGFAPLNSARGWQMRANWAEGSIRLKSLASSLKLIEAAKVQIIVCHHPFAQLDEAPLETATTRGMRGEELLSARRGRILLTGHVHAPSVNVRQMQGGDYIAIATGTLSTRLRGQKPAFNLIDVEPQHLRVLSVDVGQPWSAQNANEMRGEILFDGPISSL